MKIWAAHVYCTHCILHKSLLSYSSFVLDSQNYLYNDNFEFKIICLYCWTNLLLCDSLIVSSAFPCCWRYCVILKWHLSSEDLTDCSDLEKGEEKTFKYASARWMMMVNTHLFCGLICSILHTYQLSMYSMWCCVVGLLCWRLRW